MNQLKRVRVWNRHSCKVLLESLSVRVMPLVCVLVCGYMCVPVHVCVRLPTSIHTQRPGASSIALHLILFEMWSLSYLGVCCSRSPD